MKKILNIGGMHCKHCAASVNSALEAVSGVKSVKVNLKKQTAVVNCDAVNVDDLKAAVTNAGFEVTSIEDKKSLF